MDLNPADENFGAILRAKSVASNTLLNAQLRVDEGKLRRSTIDRLPEILKLIHAEEARIVGPIIEAAIGA